MKQPKVRVIDTLLRKDHWFIDIYSCYWIGSTKCLIYIELQNNLICLQYIEEIESYVSTCKRYIAYSEDNENYYSKELKIAN